MTYWSDILFLQQLLTFPWLCLFYPLSLLRFPFWLYSDWLLAKSSALLTNRNKTCSQHTERPLISTSMLCACVEIRDNLSEFLLSFFHVVLGSNLSSQAWKQKPLPFESSHWLKLYIYIYFINSNPEIRNYLQVMLVGCEQVRFCPGCVHWKAHMDQ